jgi:beta-glucosidase
VNPLRDPRWGRNEEGYAEDPWLTGVLGTAYAMGLRGDHPRYLKTAPTLKHFLGYNNETDRCTSSSNLPPRVLYEYELPAFRPAIAAGAAVAVMASYNLVNGRPAHVSPLLTGELRRWTDGEVLVVSDAQAPSNLVDEQRYFDDHAAGHAAALRAGVDSFTDHDGHSEVTVARITQALERGLLAEADVDRAVRRILTVRFRLGEFDPPEANPYAAVTAEVINCPAHQELARRAARRSLVLLGNDGLLPLRPGTVAVVGPLADALHGDWYSGTLPYAVTARAGLAERLGGDAVRYVEGADRIALRILGTDEYLTATDDPHGAAVRAAAPSPGRQLDLFDWGGGSCALRAAANGRHLRIDGDGALVNDSPGPHGWIVQETFRFVERSGGAVALRHPASGRYLTVAADGAVHADAAHLDHAASFVVELLRSGAEDAAAAARDADVAVVVLGNHPLVNGRETEDRADLALPAAQQALLEAVRAGNPRTVLVLCSSYPYDIGWAAANLPAVLWSAHGGQEYGRALAEVLCGDADPGGRLPQTWYRSAAELPDLLDYDIIASDATYLYYRGSPLYPFGHGHSYTTFGYENLRLSQDAVAPDGEVTVTVEVVNTGGRPGDEVVQLYTRQLRSRVKQPRRALRGFARVRLAPGERTTVALRLPAADLAFWDVTSGRMVVEAARHRVMVGRSALDIALTTTLTVQGDRIGPRAAARLRAADYDDCCDATLCDASRSAGDAVVGTERGAWIAFHDVDLAGLPGDAPAEAYALVARGNGPAATAGAPDEPPATLTLRRDNPLTGTVLARVQVPRTGDRHTFTGVTAALSGERGDGDLYLVFDAPGIVVAEVSLRAAAPSAPASRTSTPALAAW